MASNLTIEPKKQMNRFVSIWLDSENNGPTNKNRFKRFKELDVEFVAVTIPEECGKVIIEQKKVHPLPSIIIIISGALSRQNIPKFQDEFCVIAFLIYCFEVEKYQQIKYPKLRRISNDIDEITKEITILINRTDDTDDFSTFLNPGSTNSKLPQCHFRNVEKDQIRLIWLNKIHQFICAANDDENKMAKVEYVEKLLSRCEKDETQKNVVRQFSKESIEQNIQNAVRWYTKDSIIYRDLNQACRTENIVEVYSHRYMIKLISRQLKIEYGKFIRKSEELEFYRGGCVEDDYIDQIKANTGKLIAINGFWSASTKENVAKKFIRRREREGLHKILFVIKINMKNSHNSIFADVSKLSDFGPEYEIIFDLGSIFTIDSVEFNEEESCYVVSLSVSDASERIVNEYIEKTYVDDGVGVNQSILFGKFVFDMGEKKFALDYFLKIQSSLPKNDQNIWAIYYNNLGICYNADKNPDKAKECYRKALDFNEELENDRALGSIYHNVSREIVRRFEFFFDFSWQVSFSTKRNTTKPMKKRRKRIIYVKTIPRNVHQL